MDHDLAAVAEAAFDLAAAREHLAVTARAAIADGHDVYDIARLVMQAVETPMILTPPSGTGT